MRAFGLGSLVGLEYESAISGDVEGTAQGPMITVIAHCFTCDTLEDIQHFPAWHPSCGKAGRKSGRAFGITDWSKNVG